MHTPSGEEWTIEVSVDGFAMLSSASEDQWQPAVEHYPDVSHSMCPTASFSMAAVVY